MHKFWEYRDKELPRNSVERMAVLGRMGIEGWELCGILQYRFSSALGIFKRDKDA